MSESSEQSKGHRCPFIDQCRFLVDNELTMPELVERIQQTYCTTLSCCRCARFQIAQNLGLDAVPQLMLPNQNQWATQIIEEYVPESDRDSDLDLEKGGEPVEV